MRVFFMLVFLAQAAPTTPITPVAVKVEEKKPEEKPTEKPEAKKPMGKASAASCISVSCVRLAAKTGTSITALCGVGDVPDTLFVSDDRYPTAPHVICLCCPAIETPTR